MSNFFDGMFNFGAGVQEETGKSITKGVETGGSGKGLAGMFSGLTDGISGLFSGLGDSLKGIFGSMGGGGSGLLGMLGGMGGGGGLFSSLTGMSFGGFLGFSQGGVVPNTPLSQAGKDSVPAMLMPGEVVLSKNDVSRMGNGSSQPQQTVINLGITGNVDRETRRNIIQMMPQIASGVNVQNKENNFRR
jgi:hypothetical protein